MLGGFDMRFWKMAAAVAVLAGTAALGAGSPSADAKGNLIVKRFLLGRLAVNTDEFIATGGRGTANVFRDNVIQFVFTAPVDFGTLDQRTIKIGVPSGPTLFIDAKGSYYAYVVKQFDPVSGGFVAKRTYKNRVIFDPTSRQEQKEADKNPYGFLENSTYSVTVPGIDSGETKVVKSVDGRPNLQTFTTSFRTTTTYLQDYIQPSIVSVTGVDAPLIPLDGRTSVDSRADVVATFSEPMLPASFDTATSFRVFNASVGRYVTGTIRTSPDGRSFTYRPAFGYGRGPSNITVTLTTAIADRSGNVLNKGLTLNFVSEFDPFAPSYNEITEDFSTNLYEDTTYPAIVGKANWARVGTQYLEGTFSTATLEILYSNGTLQRAFPWWVAPVHVQMLHTNAVMGGTPRTISGFQWRDAYPGSYNGVYPNVVVLVGHNTTGSVDQTGAFAPSFSTTPVTVFTGSYTPPVTGEWRSGPVFTTNFLYNGTSNVVLDIDNRTAGSQPGYWRRNSTGVRTYYNTIDGAGTAYSNDLFDIRWFYLVDKSEAQSKWYDTTVTSPSFLTPIILNSKPTGTVITVSFQGGHASPTIPGSVDPNTLSGWVTDPQYGLAGFRYIRFHVDMQSNLSSGARPQIDSLTMPYIYY
jgi:hypothetical protein